ncbi:unnamed protein product [Microthlaspi erraticum]|uniref:Uncharacterized protein n=1 Tax=Microthlaspi erraticum TaxID=1685480 RepID=A0A6D2KUA9_9BRAS|nr:unnamed protein product [Microthlaspi erraticum]
MIGKDSGSTPDGDSRAFATFPCRRRKGLVEARKRNVFYGQDDVTDLMFREDEVEQDSVMRAYRSDEAMRTIQNTKRSGSGSRRRLFCCECFDFLRLVFFRDRN